MLLQISTHFKIYLLHIGSINIQPIKIINGFFERCGTLLSMTMLDKELFSRPVINSFTIRFRIRIPPHAFQAGVTQCESSEIIRDYVDFIKFRIIVVF